MDHFFTDEYYMQLAFSQAKKAFSENEVPIGAIIIIDNKIIGKAYNQVEKLKDATAHAEILAITQASQAVDNWRLNRAILYVTKEPCVMCAGAIVNSRIKKVIFGASDTKFGGCGGSFNIHNAKNSVHQVEIAGGLKENQCINILQIFFRLKRLKNKI